jgi:carbon monoxide dehydrogenase subunit G
MTSEINAPSSAVWSVLKDSSYIPKLYPDVISVESDPPGVTTVGTKYHILGKAGRRKLEIFAETVEFVEEKKAVTKNNPGGLFKSFFSVVELEQNGTETTVKISFEYELSMGYLGKIFNLVVLERLVMDNLKAYTRNLKDFSELLALPE